MSDGSSVRGKHRHDQSSVWFNLERLVQNDPLSIIMCFECYGRHPKTLPLQESKGNLQELPFLYAKYVEGCEIRHLSSLLQ